jgi:chaperonin cofactor prefoldin
MPTMPTERWDELEKRLEHTTKDLDVMSEQVRTLCARVDALVERLED